DLQRFLPRLLRTRYDGTKTRFEGMLSRSRRMWDIFDTCERVARTDATVLVLGETGTGKELIARAIHRRSQRSGRFVAVNCGAIPRDLIDSELFGHEKGAFTGAAHAKPGLFRHADGGTLFLDEIGNISEGAQASLLRVLQEGALRPVGGHDEIPVDVRVVAATSTPLEADVKAKRFREDLFYRLDVIRLVLPALRERPEDILFLFASFASRAAKQYRVERPDVNDSFLEELTSYAWPGNVRELDNFTERLILTKTPGEVLNARHFRRLMRQPDPDSHKHKEGKTRPLADLERPRTPAIEPYLDLGKPLEEALQPHLESLERAYLEACLKQNHGRIARTAEQAGISRRTLLRRLNHYGIEKSEFKESS
ncbi:MAG: sigma-54-dependent Fis family transcriptional regulator, partial [Candidatus Eisenbacteria bacterium]|nr:sigma-54-dependent Fis family transcriptional regulator [Candidatus Eisenbacteria bacterium]